MADRRPSKWVWLLVLVAGLSGAVAFAAVSMTINAQPPRPSFDGWVAVLQQGSGFSTGHQVRLSAYAERPGAPERNPVLTYAVAVCGQGRFTGILIMGGDARLSESSIPALDGSKAASIMTLHELRLTSEGTGDRVANGPAQALKLDFSRPPPCASKFDGTPDSFGLGVAQTITGLAAAPIRRPAGGPFGLWDAPRATHAWPVIGRPPGAQSKELGAFEASGGLRGSWMRPLHEYVDVDSQADRLGARALSEISRPQSKDATGLSWEAAAPIAPWARTLDSDALTRWQQYLVLATIWLTIGGGILTAALFEHLRPALLPVGGAKPESGPSVANSPGPVRGAAAPNADGDPSGRSAAAGALLLVLVLAALGRLARRRR